LGIGNRVLGIGYWALGIGHWALGITNYQLPIPYSLFPIPYSLNLYNYNDILQKICVMIEGDKEELSILNNFEIKIVPYRTHLRSFRRSSKINNI